MACYTYSMALVPLYDTLGTEAMVHILNLGEKLLVTRWPDSHLKLWVLKWKWRILTEKKVNKENVWNIQNRAVQKNVSEFFFFLTEWVSHQHWNLSWCLIKIIWGLSSSFSTSRLIPPLWLNLVLYLYETTKMFQLNHTPFKKGKLIETF